MAADTVVDNAQIYPRQRPQRRGPPPGTLHAVDDVGYTPAVTTRFSEALHATHRRFPPRFSTGHDGGDGRGVRPAAGRRCANRRHRAADDPVS
jgi:hypothetical protein